MVKYKPTYVHAGIREDGTYGIMRSADMVIVHNTKEEAEKHLDKERGNIIIDIGLVVDMNLMEGDGLNKFLDITYRRSKSD